MRMLRPVKAGRIPVIELLVLLTLFSSCVAQTPLVSDREPQAPKAQKRSKFLESTSEKEKTVEGNGKTYKVAATPLGYVSRPVSARTVSSQDLSSNSSGENQKRNSEPFSLTREKKVTEEKKVSKRKRGDGLLGKPKNLGGEESVALNFDDADIYEVIRTMADLLKISYIVDPKVQGSVTIHTVGKLRTGDLMPLFDQILEANGLTAVKKGKIYAIIDIKDASHLPIVSGIGRDQKDVPLGEKVIIQIIPLSYISPKEITKVLTPFVSQHGTIVSHEGSRSLVVVDKGRNILKILKLVDAFDVDVLEQVDYRFFPLAYMDAVELAKLLANTFSYKMKKKGPVRFIGIERLNMLMAISPVPEIFDRIQEVVKQLDVSSDVAEPRIYVYFVKNGEAGNLTDLLNQVFAEVAGKGKKDGGEKGSTAGKEASKYAGNPFAKKKEQSDKGKEPRGYEISSSLVEGTLRGKVRITADEVRNALLIQAIPSDYQIISGILNKIDVLPRQVLIEVMIAEISLDTAHQLGVEWNYLKGKGGPSTSLLSAAAGAGGLQYVVGQTDRWSAALSALASENKINILSSPSILASDNKEASINISTEVPVASAQYQYTTGTEPVIQTSIQYRNTGLILTVTPHINDRGLVTMVIKQEVSDLSNNVQVGDTTYPSFFKRSVDTTLTVKHGQTIVIGGLIKQTKSDGVSGVPGLIHVPILRWLFGKEQKSNDKSELILLITPHVITNLTDIDAITEEFKDKVGSLTQYLNR